MASKVWFITGSSKGFGRVWAEAALARGDRVAATARNKDTLSGLVEKYGDRVAAIKLDVTDKQAVDAAIAEAHRRFGRLDVVINNAGYGHFGAIEEITEAEARAQMETNVFGALWVTQAALPIMRAQGSGHIIQISSIGGVNDVLYTRGVNGLPASWLKASLRSVGLDPDNLFLPEGRSTDHLPTGVTPWRDVWSAGQGIGLIHDLPDVAELVARLQREYVAACAVPTLADAARHALEAGR